MTENLHWRDRLIPRSGLKPGPAHWPNCRPGHT